MSRTRDGAPTAADWDAVSDLKIELLSGVSPASIYKNNHNQIAVKVSVTPIDASATIITGSEMENLLRQRISLIDRAGSALHSLGDQLDSTDGCPMSTEEWFYTTRRNLFCTGQSSRDESLSATEKNDSTGAFQFIYYVMCPRTLRETSIDVGVKVIIHPDKPPVDTIGHGFGPNTVHINAVTPVVYNESHIQLDSQIAYRADENHPGTYVKLARNYIFSAKGEDNFFVRFTLPEHFIEGQFYHSFDTDPATSAYGDQHAGVERYRIFRLAYVWRPLPSDTITPVRVTKTVFDLIRNGQFGNTPESWQFSFQQEPRKFYFTVVEHDSTVGHIAGAYGYPAVTFPGNGGADQGGVYQRLDDGFDFSFTAWDQYGTSADFYADTSDLLTAFTVKPGVQKKSSD